MDKENVIQTLRSCSQSSEANLVADKQYWVETIYRLLLNARSIAIVLANVFWNQIRLLVKTRVVYDRDLFNYEQYRQQGMCDSRLLKNTLLITRSKASKSLVGEYFKF